MSDPVCPDCGEPIVMIACRPTRDRGKPLSEASARALEEIAIATHRLMVHDREQTCEHCGSTYVVPAGLRAAVEHTFDMPPHAEVAIYGFVPGQTRPFRLRGAEHNTPLIHRCARGRPYPLGDGSPAPEATEGEEDQGGPRDQAQEGRGRREHP